MFLMHFSRCQNKFERRDTFRQVSRPIVPRPREFREPSTARERALQGGPSAGPPRSLPRRNLLVKRNSTVIPNNYLQLARKKPRRILAYESTRAPGFRLFTWLKLARREGPSPDGVWARLHFACRAVCPH